MFKKDYFTLCLVLIASGSCDENEESMKVAKREASIGSFSYSASNIGKNNGGHAKTLTFIKNHDGLVKHEYQLPGTVVFSANDNFSALDNSNNQRNLNNYKTNDDGPKSTVEFWPIDLDKNKFYELKNKSPAMQYWPEQMTNHMKVKVETMPEIMYPTLPLFVPNVREVSTVANKFAITEKTVFPAAANVDENKDPGPVLFPIILDPTTLRPNKQVVAAVPRGQKHKNLKKKLNAPKVFSIVEISPPAASTVSPYDKDEDSNLNLQPTPIYEIIDEPTNYVIPSAFNPSNVNQGIVAETQYTNQDVINSLQNLKEIILNNNNISPASTNSSMMQMIDLEIESQNVEVKNDSSSAITESSEGSNSGAINAIEKPLTNSTTTTQISYMNKIAINIDSSPSELNNKMFTKLQVAVNDRDVKKIKEIAVLLQEPQGPVPFEKDINVLNIPIEAITMSSKDRRRIYLAPNIKNINQTSLNKEQEPILDSVKSIINAIYNTNEEQISTTIESTTVTDESKVYLTPRIRVGRIQMNKGSMDIPVNNFNNNSNIETSTFAALKPKIYLAPKLRNKNGTRVGRMVRRRKIQL